MSGGALVTGAGGFVGANLARRLLADGEDVTLLVRPGGDHWRLADLKDHAEIVDLDLRDGEKLERFILTCRPRTIFHLAAYGAYSWQAEPRRIVETNLTATMNLLEAACKAGFDGFVNAGSSSEYGFKDHAPGEGEVLEPNSHYALAKASSSMYCAFVARSRHLRVVTLRLYSVCGAWEEPRRLLPRLVVLGLQGRLPELADPRTARDFVAVGDVVEAFAVAAERASPEDLYFNVGSGCQTTLGEIVELSCELFGIAAAPQWNTGQHRVWDTTSWVAEISRIRDRLGWEPRRGVSEILAAMAQWMQESPEIKQRYERAAP